MGNQYVREKETHSMKRRVLSFMQSPAIKGINMRLTVNWTFLFILTWG